MSNKKVYILTKDDFEPEILKVSFNRKSLEKYVELYKSRLTGTPTRDTFEIKEYDLYDESYINSTHTEMPLFMAIYNKKIGKFEKLPLYMFGNRTECYVTIVNFDTEEYLSKKCRNDGTNCHVIDDNRIEVYVRARNSVTAFRQAQRLIDKYLKDELVEECL